MKRSPLPPRKAPLKAAKPERGTGTPRTGLKPRTRPIRPKKRTPSEAERIYGPKGFQDWLHRLPCIVCGHRGEIHAHHTENGGMGRKADWTTLVPVCPAHHRMIHDIGQKRVAAMRGKQWAFEAGRVQAAWEKYQRPYDTEARDV